MNLKISQPDLINNMTQGFNEDRKSLMTFNTPSKPHKGIVCSQESDKTKSYNLQKRYRIGVGSILYLFKHPQPDYIMWYVNSPNVCPKQT